MTKMTTDTLLRNELFKKSEFSGNSVVITYTSEGALARMKKLEVIETRQEKREGYNLFNIDTVTNHFLNSKTGAVAANNSWRLSDFIEVKAMADYLFSWTSSSSYFQVTIAMYDENKIFLNGLEYGISNIYKKVFQTIENCKYVKIAYAVRVNSTDVTRENIMLAEGTEEKPYEPFGVMPSLNYSSEIEAVGDNVQFFNKDNIIKDYRIGADGKNFASVGYFVSDYMDVKQYKQLAVNYNVDTMHRIALYDKEKNLTRAITNSRIVDVECDDCYVRICGELSKIDTMKLERGSKSTAYSKFGQGSVEISSTNENIVPFAYNSKKTHSGIDLSIDEKGVATLNGTATVKSGNLSALISNTSWKADKFPYNKKITFVCEGLVNGVTLGLGEADKNGNWLRNFTALNKNKEFVTMTCERGENAEYIRINFSIEKDTVLNNVKLYIAVVERETSEYIEQKHSKLIMQTQRKMLKGDYFDIANKKEVHKWTELVLDTEKINKLTEQNTDTTGMYRYLYKLTENVSITDKTHAQGYCTHYSMTASSGTYKKEKGFAVSRSTSDKKMYLCIYDEGETLEEFKTKIANKEIKFYLQPETPIELGCTDEQIAVLNELENMTTYADKTIITIDNNMTEMTVEAEQSRMSILEEKLKKEETV